MNRRRRLRTLRHLAEATVAWSLYYVFRAMNVESASAIGGWIARHFGPLHGVTDIARRNLTRAMPELSSAEREIVILEMWDNLGRLAAEFPHLQHRKIMTRAELRGREHLEAAVALGKPIMFVSGHLGNWEVGPCAATEFGIPLTLVYRPANNPWVDRMLRHVRGTYYMDMFAKGAARAIRIAKQIQQGQPIGIMIDQKMNDGIAVPFFGRGAMTAPAPAALALKFDMPIVMARVIRHPGVRFTVEVLPPYIPANTGDMETDTLRIMTDLNRQLEDWIREYPGQWFWVHNRWPKQ